ncbi:MAG: signal recognition particle protein [Dehalococcoidia bacterium]|nr:signal recognition particle protein [Dehalococcoidia bacterium]
MFEALTEKLSKVFGKLKGKGRLTEQDIDEALREVRLALLEADVNLKVVKGFVARLRERALVSEVLQSLSPGQQIIKLVNEELIVMLGGTGSFLTPAGRPPSIVMLVGLQGSGKTTTAAKLGLNLRRAGQRPLLVAADTRRPAAIDQLVTLGRQLDIPVYSEDPSKRPVDICAHGMNRAEEIAATWVVLDTQGRLHIDEDLMGELTEIKSRLAPNEVLLVVDAMTGQDAVRVAEEFHSRVGLTGVILTKMDGDARGGAALSVRSVTGVPIKFVGVGEKPDALEPFYPDRVASRILGMGDMLSLIEKAQNNIDAEKVKELDKKLRASKFDLEDLLWQLKEVKKMGPISQLMEMVPGFGGMAKKINMEGSEGELKKLESIIQSMTPSERKNPEIIDGSRRRRVARGSGTQPQDVNQVLNQFRQVQKLVKMMPGGKGKLPRGIARQMFPH